VLQRKLHVGCASCATHRKIVSIINGSLMSVAGRQDYSNGGRKMGEQTKGTSGEKGVSTVFQEETRYTPEKLRSQWLDRNNFPAIYKDYESPLATIDLPTKRRCFVLGSWSGAHFLPAANEEQSTKHEAEGTALLISSALPRSAF
jgi:hypothetical protein